MMSNKNIRLTEQYITMQTMFNNLLNIFQYGDDVNRQEKLFQQSEFYLQSMELFQASGDIALLIFALPGIIIRGYQAKIIEIYEIIKDTVCNKWDYYSPNNLEYSDYIYLRLQDLYKLDKLSIMINEHIKIEGTNININMLQGSDIPHEERNQVLNMESNLQAIEKFIVSIIGCINKINIFIGKIINIIDEDSIKDSYSPNIATISSLTKAKNTVEKLQEMIEANRPKKILTKDNDKVHDHMSALEDDQKIDQIIKLIKALEPKCEDHILVIAMKYVVKNFHINNKLMMGRMLEDTDYANIVSIILKDYNKTNT